MSDDDRDEHDGPLFLVVTIKPRLDRLQEAEAQLQSMRENTLKEPGCVFMHFLQPQDDSDTWVMLEMFRSRAAWDEHMRQPYNTEGNKILEDLFANPPTFACSARSRHCLFGGSTMTELNEGTLSRCHRTSLRRPMTEPNSNEVSPISEWAISTARIRPSTSIAVLLYPANTIGAS